MTIKINSNSLAIFTMMAVLLSRLLAVLLQNTLQVGKNIILQLLDDFTSFFITTKSLANVSELILHTIHPFLILAVFTHIKLILTTTTRTNTIAFNVMSVLIMLSMVSILNRVLCLLVIINQVIPYSLTRDLCKTV